MQLLCLFQPSVYATFLHDATYGYLLLVNKTLAEGGDPTNGQLMYDKARNMTFQGTSFHFPEI